MNLCANEHAYSWLQSIMHMVDSVLLSLAMPASITRLPSVSPAPSPPPPLPSPPAPVPGNATAGGGVANTDAPAASGASGGGDSGTSTASEYRLTYQLELEYISLHT